MMTLVLTKKSVSTLAKTLQAHSKLGYMQSLDVIAQSLGFAGNAPLMAALQTAPAPAPEPAQTPAAPHAWEGLPVLEAEANSDDYRIQVRIDARPYFSAVTAEELDELDRCDWCFDQEPDEIYYAAESAECPEAMKLSDYLSAVNGGGRVECGFGVRMDKTDVAVWLLEVNPELFHEAERLGIWEEEMVRDDIARRASAAQDDTPSP